MMIFRQLIGFFYDRNIIYTPAVKVYMHYMPSMQTVRKKGGDEISRGSQTSDNANLLIQLDGGTYTYETLLPSKRCALYAFTYT